MRKATYKEVYAQLTPERAYEYPVADVVEKACNQKLAIMREGFRADIERRLEEIRDRCQAFMMENSDPRPPKGSPHRRFCTEVRYIRNITVFLIEKLNGRINFAENIAHVNGELRFVPKARHISTKTMPPTKRDGVGEAVGTGSSPFK